MASTTILLLATLAAGPAVTVRVAAKPSHEISPYIYGASAVTADKALQYGLTTVRWGGNRSSRYNWKARADNAGSDWFFLNGKAGSWADFVNANRKAGLASYLTVPLLPWVAKGSEGWSFSVAKYGPQKAAESYVPDRGNGLKPDGTPIAGNDPRETSIPSTPAFQAEGIRALKLPADGPPRLYGARQRADALEPHAPGRPPRTALIRRGLRAGPRLCPGDQGGRPEGARRRPLHLGLDRPHLLGARRGQGQLRDSRRQQGPRRRPVPGLVSLPDEVRVGPAW